MFSLASENKLQHNYLVQYTFTLTNLLWGPFKFIYVKFHSIVFFLAVTEKKKKTSASAHSISRPHCHSWLIIQRPKKQLF